MGGFPGDHVVMVSLPFNHRSDRNDGPTARSGQVTSGDRQLPRTGHPQNPDFAYPFGLQRFETPIQQAIGDRTVEVRHRYSDHETRRLTNGLDLFDDHSGSSS
jgi:hypothetical protein